MQQSTSAWQKARSYTYDKLIGRVAHTWYHTTLSHIPENARVLAVGVGTGAGLLANAGVIRAKTLRIHGIDTDEAYIRHCEQLIAASDVRDLVRVTHGSIAQMAAQTYDYVCFCGSITTLGDGAAALRRAADVLADARHGRVLVAQTFQLRKNWLLEWVQPRLAHVTSLDFGQVAYEEDFEEMIAQAGLCVAFVEPVEDGLRVDGVQESRVVCVRLRDEREQVFETVV